MWKRLLTCVFAMAMCLGATLSSGSGVANANILASIARAADDLAPYVAGKHNLVAGQVRSLFVSQTRSLTPVSDEVALAEVKTAWRQFEPRTPGQYEVTARRPALPSVYRTTAAMLCQTAADLLVTEEKSGWKFLIDQVNGHVAALNPVGRNLALYNELNDIAQKFLCGEYCAATAKLAVLVAKEAYC